MNCKDCAFWKSNDDETVGDCRVHAPVAHILPVLDAFGNPGLRTESMFPQTRPDIWCGEYKNRTDYAVQGLIENLSKESVK